MKTAIALFTACVLWSNLTYAQGNLENPVAGSTESGITIISGWHCTASRITAEIDGVNIGKAGSGTNRTDTVSVCGHAETGYSLLINYGVLTPGSHTIRVYADGNLSETRQFNSIQSGGADFVTGLSKTVTISDFPSSGRTATLQWSQAKQSFVVTGLTSVPPVVVPPGAPAPVAIVPLPAFQPIDVFEGLSSVISGGERHVTIIANDTRKSSSYGCGYKAIFPSRAESDQQVLSLGGSVTRSTLTEWCGTAAGESACIEEFDRLFVIDDRMLLQNRTTLYMTGLVPNHWTEVDFDSAASTGLGASGPNTEIRAVTKDASVTNGATCNNSLSPNQLEDSINGVWIGYEATYSVTTMTGLTAAATVACANQICTINSSSGVTSITLSDFIGSKGAWLTAAGAPKFAGASISVDRQLLSMFVCNAPLDEARTFENCSFFSFQR